MLTGVGKKKGRTVERSTGKAGKYVITFADGSALTIKSVTTAPDLSVSVTAVFEGADLADPVLVKHKLDASHGDADLAARLAALAKGQDQPVVREISNSPVANSATSPNRAGLALLGIGPEGCYCLS